MKRFELTLLAKDADAALEYLGRTGAMQFAEEARKQPPDQGSAEKLSSFEEKEGKEGKKEILEKIRSAAGYLGILLPMEPEESAKLPGPEEEARTERLCAEIAEVNAAEIAAKQEKAKIEHTLEESRSFVNLNAPFKDFDQLSYLTLRIGHIDPKGPSDLRERLADRAIVIPLGENRVLAAASRKGRFALDTELKKHSFTAMTIPEEFRGIPAEMIATLESRLDQVSGEVDRLEALKRDLKSRHERDLRFLASSYIMAHIIEEIKRHLIGTKTAFLLTGWVPAARTSEIAKNLAEITEGRISLKTFDPEEIETVQTGAEKVPVSLKHKGFVKGFESLVLSYGAPLYGAIDPTPFVAVFFPIFFGIMFGDFGQGLVLLLLGLLTSEKGLKKFAKLRIYSKPLISVSIASMIMGLLTGECFANHTLLAGPTRKVLELLGVENPEVPILHLMPSSHSIGTIFLFFGFTIVLGIILNSIGLWLNVINHFAMKQYERALFSKTGLAGIAVFWYALFIGVRCIAGGSIAWFDALGLGLPLICIVAGHPLWRLITGKRPLLGEGLFLFCIEGVVEILEVLSTYISSTVSFVRVGAFAVSHAVLSFVVFYLADMVSKVPVGPLFSLGIILVGNGIIILLEGMIVAIQVARLQYYEFFSKFFTEMGAKFKPFRFRGNVVSDAAVLGRASGNSK
ncbi:MAG: V-type ATP synthase subunit I [Spirochaetaceae bacterium]|jgi:V/A-type H+-transporting ATPase subunit I|nr:V-type ATP synthase subunit I [Spirochaetaceae bacterium]